jgi:hypothetical protein
MKRTNGQKAKMQKNKRIQKIGKKFGNKLKIKKLKKEFSISSKVPLLDLFPLLIR